jgi:voltage-gated potassium channel
LKPTSVEALQVDTRAELVERRFEKPLIVAAVLSVPTTILQVSQTGEPWQVLGSVLNWLIWLAFLAELVTMLAVVPNRGRYLLTHPIEVGIVVLTPPFLSSLVQSARLLRLLRVFRLLRLAPLVRVVFSQQGVKAVASLALLVALAGGAGFAAQENLTFGDGLYWAITTMTTVGYGDITPHTPEGKAIAVIVMLVGIGTATLVIGAVAQRFLAGEVEEIEMAEDEVLSEIRDIATRLVKLEQAIKTQRRRR